MKSFKEYLAENINVYDLTKNQKPKSNNFLGVNVKTELGSGTVEDVIGPNNQKLEVKLDSGKKVVVDTSGKKVK